MDYGAEYTEMPIPDDECLLSSRGEIYQISIQGESIHFHLYVRQTRRADSDKYSNYLGLYHKRIGVDC